MSSRSNKYIDLKNNGRLFPVWVMHNFKKYKLPEIMRGKDEDRCNSSRDAKKELNRYQSFLAEFIGPGRPYNEMLLYHNMGSGKTISAINLINIMYDADPNFNVILLIKASLKKDPWLKEMKEWLRMDAGENDFKKSKIFATIHFVHYDSPFADKDFMEVIKRIDTTKPILYLIEEAHNFIRNVYSNMNSKTGKRAQVIYDYIMQDRKENRNNKLVMMSATPAINKPFELSLVFNLLRPGIFPLNELEFNSIYITDSAYPILNPARKNMFQRRIMGLISYYVGATPDLFAKRDLQHDDLEMSNNQYTIYKFYEDMETEIMKKRKNFGRNSSSPQIYRSYTRSASNFVFPHVGSEIAGELRPRPKHFNLVENIGEIIEEGKGGQIEIKQSVDIQKYLAAMKKFIDGTEKYFKDIARKEIEEGKQTLKKELEEFKRGFEEDYKKKFKNYHYKIKDHSPLYKELYECSPKMLAILFYSYLSPGPVYIYSNFVHMEGIEVLKIYFNVAGYGPYKEKPGDYFGYCEYHGDVDVEEREKIRNFFNDSENKYGKLCKILFLSPSGAEGINLMSVRQCHILEPHWNEVRIIQITGRGYRYCSHKLLPESERQITIYRYNILKPKKYQSEDPVPVTADQILESAAKAHYTLIESFQLPMRQVSVDCELFKAHNMASQHYNCFQFDENNLMLKHIGPAYKDDIKDDVKYDGGLNAINTYVETIKVIKIMGVFQEKEEKYSAQVDYWYHEPTGMVYDYEMKYPVGRVLYSDNGLPFMIDKNVYVITDVIQIPTI
jgi:superfamily II DNA or RNA helicase